MLHTLRSAVALVLFGALAFAQLGGWTWTKQGCVTLTPTTAVLEVCATCGSDNTKLIATAPDSGLVALDIAWTTIDNCCVQFDVLVENPGVSQASFYHQHASWGAGWCAPSLPPCSGGASIAFPVVKGELIKILLNAVATDQCIFGPPSATTVSMTNWSFTPDVVPAILKADASFAGSTESITIHGDNFDATSQVSLDGVPRPVLSQTNEQLVIDPGLDVPGWRDVTVSNAVGGATKVDALLRWPALAATLSSSGTFFDLHMLVHFSGGGSWWLALAASALPVQIPIPGIEFGLLLDPAAGLFLLPKGSMPASQKVGVKHLYLPYDASLAGVPIPVQALVLMPSLGKLGFTNLAAPIAP